MNLVLWDFTVYSAASDSFIIYMVSTFLPCLATLERMASSSSSRAATFENVTTPTYFNRSSTLGSSLLMKFDMNFFCSAFTTSKEQMSSKFSA